MIRFILFISVSLLIHIPETFSQGKSENNLCSYYQEKLENISHEKLTHQIGMILSPFDGKEYPGCQLSFASNDTLISGYNLPHFITNFEETELYQQGWRQNDKYIADGPGSSLFGIEHEDNSCLITFNQSAELNEVGDVEQSSFISITVECFSKQHH